MEITTESETNFEITHVKNIYNQIATSFDNTRKHNFWVSVTNYIHLLDSNTKILDLGCGNGKYIPLFKPNQELYALDNSEEFIKIVNSRYPHVKTIVSDVTNTTYKSDYFDHIISIAVIHHLASVDRRIQMIKEIYRILKINGTAMITAWAISAYNKKFSKLNGFGLNDFLVSWDNNFNRFYHLFELNEFEELIELAGLNDKVVITFKIFECDNYAIQIKKLS